MNTTEEMYYGLTDIQRRRCGMKARGMRGAEIARAENVTPSAVYSSISLAERKMIRNARIIKFVNSKYNPSERSLRVVAMVKGGMSERKVAKAMGLSRRTVRTHVARHKERKEKISIGITRAITLKPPPALTELQRGRLNPWGRQTDTKAERIMKNEGISLSAASKAIWDVRNKIKKTRKYFRSLPIRSTIY
jgi:DNA-binding CsgD family transcriptional regulator